MKKYAAKFHILQCMMSIWQLLFCSYLFTKLAQSYIDFLAIDYQLKYFMEFDFTMFFGIALSSIVLVGFINIRGIITDRMNHDKLEEIEKKLDKFSSGCFYAIVLLLILFVVIQSIYRIY